MTPRARPSVTSQSRSSHHNNMKVFVALAGLVAVTSAYPMFLLEDTDAAYAPIYRVARQVPQFADDVQIQPSRFAQEEEDLETAAVQFKKTFEDGRRSKREDIDARIPFASDDEIDIQGFLSKIFIVSKELLL